MNRRTVLRVVMTLGVAGVFGQSVGSSAQAAESFKVDTVHSTVFFRVKHMGVSYSYGRFNEVTGSFTIDEADAAKSKFDIEIKTASLDSGAANRDRHLKSPDFFDVKQFPVATFISDSVKKLGTDRYEVSGKFTLHGVTRPLKAEVRHVGTGKGQRGSTISGFESTFTIKRSDFDMNFMIGPDKLGDEVRITISIEGGHRGERGGN